MQSFFPLIPGIVIFVILVAAIIALSVWVVSLSRRVSKVTAALIEDRHKLSQMSRFLSSKNGHPAPSAQSRQNNPHPQAVMRQNNPSAIKPNGQFASRQPEQMHSGMPSNRAGASMHPVDVFMSEAVREEPPAKKQKRGRRDKPVIPFGVNRSEQQRAAQRAAEMIDYSPNLSMNLNEPAMRQMQTERAQQGMRDVRMQPLPSQRNMQQRSAQQRGAQPQRVHRMNLEQDRQQSEQRSQSYRPREEGGQVRDVRIPQDRVQERAAARMPQRFQSPQISQSSQARVQDRASGRISERAQEREQAHIRRQAQRIISEYRRQSETAARVSDMVGSDGQSGPDGPVNTIRFDRER